eukprot:gene33561-39048_t
MTAMDRKFTEDHEWIDIAGDIATVGITDFAQSQLGDVVFAELPKVGAKVAKGDAVAVVESVKAASDVYSPLTGEIVEVNSAVAEDPALINTAPEAPPVQCRRTRRASG